MRLVDRLAFVLAFVASWTVAVATAAYGQVDSILFEMTPAEVARTVFEQPYGKALVTEAAKVLRSSADPRCLAEKKLDEPQLEAKARELLVHYGARMIEYHRGFADLKKIEAAIEARAGPGVKDEIARLRSTPEVAEFNKLSAPARFAVNADNIVERFELYLVLNRFHLMGAISPAATGDERLMNLRDAVEESMEPLLAAKRPAALARYLELGKLIEEEFVKAVDPQDLKRRFAPWSSFRGVEAELVALCVTGKSRW